MNKRQRYRVNFLRESASATLANLRAPDRRGRVADAIRQWTFSGAAELPEVTVLDTFPGIGAIRAAVSMDVSHAFELPHGERAIIDAIVRWKDPRVIFELGTYTGSTTVVMAEAASPGTEVHTIDLPVEQCGPKLDAQIGSAIRRWTPNDTEVVQHRTNIDDFDFSPWKGKVDLAYVDASHDYEDVLRDSLLAIDLVADDGVVIWDDYQAPHPGVVKALNEVARTHPLKHLAGARLAVLLKG